MAAITTHQIREAVLNAPDYHLVSQGDQGENQFIQNIFNKLRPNYFFRDIDLEGRVKQVVEECKTCKKVLEFVKLGKDNVAQSPLLKTDALAIEVDPNLFEKVLPPLPEMINAVTLESLAKGWRAAVRACQEMAFHRLAEKKYWLQTVEGLSEEQIRACFRSVAQEHDTFEEAACAFVTISPRENIKKALGPQAIKGFLERLLRLFWHIGSLFRLWWAYKSPYLDRGAIWGASRTIHCPLYTYPSDQSKPDPAFLQSTQFKELQQLDPRFAGPDAKSYRDRLNFIKGTCWGQSHVALKYTDQVDPASPHHSKEWLSRVRNEALLFHALNKSFNYYDDLGQLKKHLERTSQSPADFVKNGNLDYDKLSSCYRACFPTISKADADDMAQKTLSISDLQSSSAELFARAKRIDQVFKQKMQEPVSPPGKPRVYTPNIYQTPKEHRHDSGAHLKDYLMKNPGTFCLGFSNYASDSISGHGIYIKVDATGCSVYDGNEKWYFFDNPEKGIAEVIDYFERFIPTSPTASAKSSGFYLARLA